MAGVTLRYPYEVREQKDYFDDIEDEKVQKDMLDLAVHIVESKKGKFEPEKFEDDYENAVKELFAQEAERRANRTAERAFTYQRRQSNRCTTPKRRPGEACAGLAKEEA
jgi:DNA end-binding protein Ku